MLIFSIIFEQTDYEGALYLWVLVIPFLIAIVLTRKEYRYDLLMINSSQFDSLNQANSQLQYISKIINFYSRDPNIATVLNGFVECH